MRHRPPVVHAVRRRHGAASVRHAEHRGRLPGVQGPAPLRQPYRQRAGLVVVRADQPLHEVRAVGHRAVAVELRRRRPHRGGRRPLRRRLHLGGPAPDEPGTYRQVLAAAASRHRQRAGARLVPPHPEERPVRLAVPETLVELAVHRGAGHGPDRLRGARAERRLPLRLPDPPAHRGRHRPDHGGLGDRRRRRPAALPRLRPAEQPLDLLAGAPGGGRGPLGGRELAEVHELLRPGSLPSA